MEMKRALLLAMAGLSLMCVMTAVGVLADQEPNDDYANAEVLPSATVKGRVTIDTDESD